MRYFCLACDYDGTIARDGHVSPSTVEALKRVSASGRKLVLATGRELPDLLRVFPEISIFDRVVVENGAVLYRPERKDYQVLADPPPREFVETLAKQGVNPLSVGHCIVSTWHPWETKVLDVIRTSGLEFQVIFNKNAVMILPSGVNKATGLKVALTELGLSLHNVVGIGDAENDHAFLGMCECSAAVDNALPALKERVDWISHASHGAGAEELIEKLIGNDLQEVAPRLRRHWILLGRGEKGEEVCLEPYGTHLLVAGPSGSGKSTAMTAILERLVNKGYQVCLIDPEGDYDEFEPFVTLGAPDRIPGIAEILKVLNAPKSISINLLGVSLADRPAFFETLLARIQELRSQTGRPHWVVIDEAHHLLPRELDPAKLAIPKELTGLGLISAHPDSVAEGMLKSINHLIAVGPDPGSVVNQFCTSSGREAQSVEIPRGRPKQPDEVLLWRVGERQAVCVEVEHGKAQLRRHRRKYAEGELGEDKSFYFRGRDGKLNLRAQNMNMFAQMAAGVDDETWTHHLRNSDYSRWVRESVKDRALADEIASIEREQHLPPSQSRNRIVETIRKHYMTSL